MNIKKTFIIAEIGTSHGGDINKGIQLIKGAKEAGADCAKFQVVFADEILHKNTGMVNLPTGNIPLYNMFKSLEKNKDFYRQLKSETEKAGLEFLASPFGEKSAELLYDIGVNSFKVASPELNHIPLLKKLVNYNKEILISCGVSKLEDIERALEITGVSQTTLLHCITSYPAPEEEYNIKLVKNLREIFGVKTGISDHSLDPVLVPSLAVLFGATVIEKHITLSNTTDGLDDPVALNLNNFKIMCDSIRLFETLSFEDGISKLVTIFGQDKIDKVIGNGIKKLSRSEATNYGRTNRSLHSIKELQEGEILTRDNSALLRTEKVLRPGILPHLVDNFYGKKLTKTVPDGEGIRLEDFL